MLVSTDFVQLLGLALLVFGAIAFGLLSLALRVKCAVAGHDVQPWGICNRYGKRNLAP